MSDDFVQGQRLGDYEILGVLGAGGMGKVYKVRNVISDRVEAMKILLGNLAGQKELADRFLREIKLLASLDHPNIAKLNTALTLDNQLVMLMEYVDGVTLASRLEKGPIPPADAVNYSEQLLSALSYAHKLNVIHRDVKPGNMMLTSQGVVKLMDFGIARPNNEVGMTLTGTTLGSLNYMSPEQVKGEPVDARSDLYSFGVSLYEMVTGQLPFRGNSNYSVMSAHLQEIPQPPVKLRPDLPSGLSDIIVMSMAKNPNDRFQSADAFANALKAVMGGGAARPATVAAAPAASAVRPQLPFRCNLRRPPPLLPLHRAAIAASTWRSAACLSLRSSPLARFTARTGSRLARAVAPLSNLKLSPQNRRSRQPRNLRTLPSIFLPLPMMPCLRRRPLPITQTQRRWQPHLRLPLKTTQPPRPPRKPLGKLRKRPRVKPLN